MAYQARAGACVAGATYAGLVNYKLQAKIDTPLGTLEQLPTGDGFPGVWLRSTGGFGDNFPLVDDPIDAPDDDATYIFRLASELPSNDIAAFTFAPFDIPPGLEIRSVRVYLRCKLVDGGDGPWVPNAVLDMNGAFHRAASVDAIYTTVEDVYTTSFVQWATSPVTGRPWTAADIADIEQFGVAGSSPVAGVVRCTQTYLQVRLGELVIRGVQLGSLAINHTVSQPSTCAFQVEGFEVRGGQRVLISDDGAQNYLFGGQVDMVNRTLQEGEPTVLDVSCTDWTWLANSAPIWRTFTELSVNTAVTALIDDVRAVTNLDLRPGSIPEDLGTVSLVLSGVNFAQAMTQLCSVTNCLFSVRPNLHVDVYRDEPPHENVVELVQDTSARALVVQELRTNLRTEVSYECQGSTVSAWTPAGSLFIPVQDTAPFQNPSGGEVFLVVPGVTPFYMAAFSPVPASGPGNVHLPVALSVTLEEGTPIAPMVVELDSAARNELADDMSFGLSGVRRLHFVDQGIRLTEGRGRCLQHLAFYGRKIEQVNGELDNVFLAPAIFRHWNVVGRFVQVDIVSPEGTEVVGEFRLSTVNLTLWADIVYPDDDGGASQRLLQQFELRPGKRQDIVDILVQQQGI